MGLSKGQRRQLAIKDFGTDSVPVVLRREARLLAAKKKISPREALERVRAKFRGKLARLKQQNEKALRRVLRRRRPKTRPVDLNPAQKQSTWPDNPNKGYVSIVSGGLPSFGKRR